jgi:hypothetical protein
VVRMFSAEEKARLVEEYEAAVGVCCIHPREPALSAAFPINSAQLRTSPRSSRLG